MLNTFGIALDLEMLHEQEFSESSTRANEANKKNQISISVNGTTLSRSLTIKSMN